MSKTQGDHVGEINKMITAVEWFVEQLQAPCRCIPSHIIDKAKEIDKQQKIDAYKHGQNNGYSYKYGCVNIISAETYYEQTFNK